MNKLFYRGKAVKKLFWRQKEVVELYQGKILMWRKEEYKPPYLDIKHETIFIFDSTADNEILSNVQWQVN